MRNVFKSWVIIVLFILAACSNATTPKKINMYNTDGDMVGTASLSESPDGVKIKLKVEGLTPGWYGIHIHENPSCKGPEFKSAGNHFNPENKEHGLMNPKGPHLGDLQNVEADDDGLVDEELTVQDATMFEGKKSLLQNGGTSLIITKDQDDGQSQPAGNSGVRLICGEIKTSKKDSQTESPTDPTEVGDTKDKE